MERLTIGEVAKQAHVRIETLRYYERTGLVASPPRSRIELPALSSRNGAARPVYQACARTGLLAQGNYGTACTAGDTRDPMCWIFVGGR